HRHRDPAVQVVTLAGEDVVRTLVDLHVEVAGRTTAGPDLALPGEPDPHPVLHAGRDLHRERAAAAYPPVAGAGRARVRDGDAGALAGDAGPRRDHLPQEGPLYRLHLALPAAGLTRGRVGARRGAGPAARRAD